MAEPFLSIPPAEWTDSSSRQVGHVLTYWVKLLCLVYSVGWTQEGRRVSGVRRVNALLVPCLPWESDDWPRRTLLFAWLLSISGLREDLPTFCSSTTADSHLLVESMTSPTLFTIFFKYIDEKILDYVPSFQDERPLNKSYSPWVVQIYKTYPATKAVFHWFLVFVQGSRIIWLIHINSEMLKCHWIAIYSTSL